MKWNIFLVAVSVSLLFLVWMDAEAGWVVAGSNGAQILAPQIGVDEDTIRPALTEFLRESSERRALMNTVALAILSLLLTVRLVADVVRTKEPPAARSGSR